MLRLSSGKEIPIEMHKARMVQKVWLVSPEERLKERYQKFRKIGIFTQEE